MKVLHVYKSSMPENFGGVETVIDSIIMSSKKYGIDSNVLSISNNKSSTVKFNNYFVHQIKDDFTLYSCPFSIEFLFTLKRLSTQFDLIHYHFPWPYMDFCHFFLRVKTPYILTYHSEIVKQKILKIVYLPLMNLFLSSAKKIIFTSPNLMHSNKFFKYYKNKCCVIPIGLNISDYNTSIVFTKRKWDIFTKKKFFLFVGVLRYYKGLEILLEAAKDLSQNFVIAGTGPIERSLKIKAKNLKLNNVFFVGKITQNEKMYLLKLCYAFILPSHLPAEAFGVCLLEASIFSKPLITTNIGTGTTYININNLTGKVVKPNNALELKKAILSLSADESKAKKMGINAKNRFIKKFTANKMGLDYFKLYRKILNQR